MIGSESKRRIARSWVGLALLAALCAILLSLLAPRAAGPGAPRTANAELVILTRGSVEGTIAPTG